MQVCPRTELARSGQRGRLSRMAFWVVPFPSRVPGAMLDVAQSSSEYSPHRSGTRPPIYDRPMHGRRAGRRASIAACLLSLGALIAATGATSAPALPVARAADATTSQKPVLIPLGFELRSSNSYTIEVTVLHIVGAPAYANILVSGQSGFVSYIAPASATEDSFEADLGALGHIAVTFHATEGSRLQGSCVKNQSIRVASGDHEGTIDFHGEEGYTNVEASQAKADSSRPLSVICPAGKSESGRGPGLPGAEVRVRGKNPARTPSLTVVENDPRAPVRARSTHLRTAPRNRDQKNDPHEGPQDLFRLRLEAPDRHPAASVPLLGHARFRRIGRRKSRWSGDLTVDLPGQSGVRLTGRHLERACSAPVSRGPARSNEDTDRTCAGRGKSAVALASKQALADRRRGCLLWTSCGSTAQLPARSRISREKHAPDTRGPPPR